MQEGWGILRYLTVPSCVSPQAAESERCDWSVSGSASVRE